MDIKGKIDLIINLSYIGQDNVNTGEIIQTGYYSNPEVKAGYKLPETISLSDLRHYYQQSGEPAGEIYKNFVDYIKTYKNNPEILNNISNVILGELAFQYDENSNGTVKVYQNPEEFLLKILNSDKNSEIKDLTCGDITNFVRDVFIEAGIDAFTVVGAQNRGIDDFTNHAFLLFKNSDGTYTFNNYGQSARIKADSIKDAIYTIQKEGGFFENSGQISIQGQSSSYQEFALSESSAYGHEIDKREYNTTNPFEHDFTKKSKIDISLAKMHGDNFLNCKYGVDVVLAKESHKKLKNFNFGFERKRLGKNAEFDNSKSIGIKFGYKEKKDINKNNDLIYGIKTIYSHTSGEVNGQNYKTYLGANGSIPSHDISHETLMLRGSVQVDTKMLTNNNLQLKNSAGISLMANGTIGHSTHLSSSFDGRAIVEDGIKFSNKKNKHDISSFVSAGAVVDLQENINVVKPSFGGKFNLGVKYTGEIAPNTDIFTKADGFIVHTKSSTDYGVGVNAGINYLTPNNKKIKKIFVNGSCSFINQNLHIDNYSENSEKTTTINASAGVDFGKTSVSLNYNRYGYLNSTKNKNVIMATIGVNL